MSIIKVSNLTKRFHKFTAVDDISFELKEGEILGILGPNGAGKTTTIQMLLGVLTPTSGSIFYFGKDITVNREEILEQVNFSSTYTNLPWNLTVKENLSFVSFLYQIKNRDERIKKMVEVFRLEKIYNSQLKDLSSGQITRVNLAKAMINFPRVLLLDEPTASLDPETAQHIKNFLLEQRKNFHVSIVLTSHNMAEVEDVCDRVLFINQGKIIDNDTPANLAKTLEVCHVELNVADGLKRTIELCETSNRPYRLDNRYIVIDLKEKDIPDFLRQLMDKGVFYDQISIEKPTLEDYFLERSRQ